MGGLKPEVVEQAGEIPRLVLDRVPSRGAGRGVTAAPVVRDEVEVRREAALPLAPCVLFGIEDGPREAGEAAMNEDDRLAAAVFAVAHPETVDLSDRHGQSRVAPTPRFDEARGSLREWRGSKDVLSGPFACLLESASWWRS